MPRPTQFWIMVLGLGLAFWGWGADAPASSATPPGNLEANPALVRPVHSAGSRTNRLMVSGYISRLDRTNHWLEVESTNGVHRLSYRTNTSILLVGKQLSADELLVGDRGGFLARPGTNGTWDLISLRLGPRGGKIGNPKPPVPELPSR